MKYCYCLMFVGVIIASEKTDFEIAGLQPVSHESSQEKKFVIGQQNALYKVPIEAMAVLNTTSYTGEYPLAIAGANKLSIYHQDASGQYQLRTDTTFPQYDPHIPIAFSRLKMLVFKPGSQRDEERILVSKGNVVDVFSSIQAEVPDSMLSGLWSLFSSKAERKDLRSFDPSHTQRLEHLQRITAALPINTLALRTVDQTDRSASVWLALALSQDAPFVQRRDDAQKVSKFTALDWMSSCFDSARLTSIDPDKNPIGAGYPQGVTQLRFLDKGDTVIMGGYNTDYEYTITTVVKNLKTGQSVFKIIKAQEGVNNLCVPNLFPAVGYLITTKEPHWKILQELCKNFVKASIVAGGSLLTSSFLKRSDEQEVSIELTIKDQESPDFEQVFNVSDKSNVQVDECGNVFICVSSTGDVTVGCRKHAMGARRFLSERARELLTRRSTDKK